MAMQHDISEKSFPQPGYAHATVPEVVYEQDYPLGEVCPAAIPPLTHAHAQFPAQASHSKDPPAHEDARAEQPHAASDESWQVPGHSPDSMPGHSMADCMHGKALDWVQKPQKEQNQEQQGEQQQPQVHELVGGPYPEPGQQWQWQDEYPAPQVKAIMSG